MDPPKQHAPNTALLAGGPEDRTSPPKSQPNLIQSVNGGTRTRRHVNNLLTADVMPRLCQHQRNNPQQQMKECDQTNHVRVGVRLEVEEGPPPLPGRA